MTELKAAIQKLKQQKNAVILAHNYQLDEVQEVADYVGDSLFLSQMAANTDCDVIVFCGVRFMAETAKILSPQKTVLLPESDAGCPLADMITAEDLRKLKTDNPGVPVVCYINSSVEVKAESDVCCTSANAVKIVNSLPGNKAIFVPDENLGQYVAKQVSDKQLICWKGYCITHAKVRTEDVHFIRDKFPKAKLLVHPECHPDVAALADFTGSTTEIIRYAQKSDTKTLIIGTEMGVFYKLRADNPDKQFFLLHPGLVCPNMKKTRIESVYNALADNQYEIQVDKYLEQSARRALERMLEVV